MAAHRRDAGDPWVVYVLQSADPELHFYIGLAADR
jgi:hypothetical protein